MSKKGIVTKGVVVFSTITEHDVYNGKSTGNYTLTIGVSDAEASKLTDAGVKVKEYTNKDGDVTLQRKFKSQYHVPVVDTEDHPVSGEIPFGSTVNVLWVAGEPHPEHGVGTYMNRVRLLERSENEAEVPEEF